MVQTAISGVFQGDIIVRSAIILAIKELREHPELIEDALASLPQDDLTAGRYGEKTIAECKDWFLKTKVPVKLGISLNHLAETPVIAVEMGQNSEGESTLGDVHYQTTEADPHIAGNRRTLGSVVANETYTVALFVEGEPEYLLFLYSLILFSLLRRKDDLLARRGFEWTSFSCGVAGQVDFGKDNLYTRTIQLTGKARHSWPIQSGTTVKAVEFTLTNVGGKVQRVAFGQGWEDLDVLGLQPAQSRVDVMVTDGVQRAIVDTSGGGVSAS